MKNGDMPLSKLADELIMERTSLYRTISRLHDMRAVEIRQGTKGRAKVAAVTPQGEAFVAQCKPFWDRAQETVIGTFGEKEWLALSQKLLTIPALIKDSTKS